MMRRLRRINYNFPLHPCITLTSEPGSRGRDIAQKVARSLKLAAYDREIVTLIAKSSHISRKLIATLDEKSLNAVDGIVNSLFGFSNPSEYKYIKTLAKVILGIAAGQPAVIIGRGANFILPAETILRVRTQAPFMTRVKYTSEDDHLTINQAKEKIRNLHTENKGFISKYFNKNISNANYYDLVVNTKLLNINQASEVIITGYKGKFLS